VRVLALQYHDVVGPEGPDASGFPGASAATYKLDAENFAAHVRAASRVVAPPRRARATDLVPRWDAAARGGPPVLLTFDDGGVSAATRAADVLEGEGWRGHFFVTTDYVGTRGFCDAAQLRALHSRGHVIGAHSCSHPTRMSRCDDATLRREWGGSVARLADVLGAAPASASVPGGYFSRRVAEAAAECGVRVLFTSEPVATAYEVEGALVVGRYTLRRSSPPSEAAALAAGRVAPRCAQWTAWNAKKVLKRVAGEGYLRARSVLLRG
jgi:peptidoglycan/xylan/chitin deacetylase (PgdA/CDA1 family)